MYDDESVTDEFVRYVAMIAPCSYDSVFDIVPYATDYLDEPHDMDGCMFWLESVLDEPGKDSLHTLDKALEVQGSQQTGHQLPASWSPLHLKASLGTPDQCVDELRLHVIGTLEW